MLLSIVIPAYNESEGIDEFHNKLLIPGIKAAKINFEIIYVNDGSRDDTLEHLTALADKDKRIKVISLSRNFGKEIATTAGIHHAKGDATIILDADGQHPPNIMKEFVSRWRQGAQVVIGVRKTSSHEGLVKKIGSSVFYRLFNTSSETELVPGSTDYRLIDRVVQQEFIKFGERNRITRGLIDWLGFRRDYIEFDSPERLAGTASYRTSQLVKLALNSFVSLSLKPLFLFGWVGAFIILASLIFGLFIIIEQFLMNDPLALHFSGSVILGVFMSFMIGLVLVSQATLATYISHIHQQSQGRPLYVVDKSRSSNI